MKYGVRAFALVASILGCLGCSGLTGPAQSVFDIQKARTEDLRQWVRDGGGPKNLLVFVHGFNSSITAAWGDFPVLVRDDPEFVSFNILLFGYPTELCRQTTDIERAGELLASYLKSIGPGYDSITLVGHSMGGLITLNGLLTMEQKAPDLFERMTITLLTFGTPHAGVPGAKLLPLLCENKQAEGMEVLNDTLSRLHERWQTRFGEGTGKEGKATRRVPVHAYFGHSDEFVPRASACAGFEKYCEEVDGNHSSMVKPRIARDAVTTAAAPDKARDHLSYRKLREVTSPLRTSAPQRLSFEEVRKRAIALRDAGKTKEYVETLEALLKDQAALATVEETARPEARASVHFDIAFELSQHDYIEGMPDRITRALVHLEQSRQLAGEWVHPMYFALAGYLTALYSDSPSTKSRVDDLFARGQALGERLPADRRSGFYALHYSYRGYALHKLKDYDRARSAFKSALAAIDSGPPSLGALRDGLQYRLGLIEFVTTQQLDRASPYWEKIADKYYTQRALEMTGLGYWEQGWQASREGAEARAREHFAAAEEALSAAARLGQQSYNLNLALGILHFQRADYVNAEPNFQALTRARPDESLGYYWLARTRFMAKKLEPAREAIEESIKRDDRSGSAHYWYGRILANLSEPKLAIREYEKSIARDDTDPKVYFHLAVELAASSTKEAGKEKSRALEKALKYCRDGISRATDAEDVDKRGELRRLEGLKTLILNGLAFEYAEQGSLLDLAGKYIDEGLQGDPESPELLDTKAWVMARRAELTPSYSRTERTGLYDAAQDLLRNAIKRLPPKDTGTRAEMLYHLGYIAKLKCDDKEAKRLFMEALAIEPEHNRSKDALNTGPSPCAG